MAAETTQKAQKQLETLFVAVDVEKKGPGFDFPVIQLGVAFGTNIQNIQKMSVCFDHKDVPFQEKCFNEFWKTRQELYNKILAEAKPPTEQWKTFVEWFDGLEKKYPKIELASDNPAYVLEAIDFHVWKECKRLPLRYSSTGEYRSVSDPTEQLAGMPPRIADVIKKTVDETNPATHWAADDAANILSTFFCVRQLTTTLKKS